MELSAEIIKQLRDRTGVSVMQCREALKEAGGDLGKAEEILMKRSGGIAGKKSDRDLAAGYVATYVHDGSIGAMVLLSSETDFVAKNPEFGSLAREIAMQVSAMAPRDTAELMDQPYIKDDSKTIKALLDAATQKFGERIEVSEFARVSAR